MTNSGIIFCLIGKNLPGTLEVPGTFLHDTVIPLCRQLPEHLRLRLQFACASGTSGRGRGGGPLAFKERQMHRVVFEDQPADLVNSDNRIIELHEKLVAREGGLPLGVLSDFLNRICGSEGGEQL
ncbi:hypothetical protein IH799_06610, partial [candidate division KSB1 bacterium]|nr:hypothetical protein [candidate division KSB1 bacterium]